MALSDQQRAAVERLGQNVCVVAGPGSGKTRVLIERFAHLVEHHGVDPTRILAITFTEKAAIAIKQRLIERFAGRADLRESIERAWVSTIHGFCARLLRENAIAAGLDPAFAVLEQAAAERLQREAAEQALDDLFAEHPGPMRALMEAIDLSTSDDFRQPDLAQAIVEVYEAMRVAGEHQINVPPARPGRYSTARLLAEDIVRTPPAGNHGPILYEWARAFLGLPESPITLAHFDALTFDAHLNKVGGHPAARPLKQEILPALAAEWAAAYYNDLYPLLRTAISRFGRVYRERKRAESVVDFPDLEGITVRLLETHPSIRRETADRFTEVMMDELQDTNRMQWRLVDLIRTCLFAVGDINQSIYGFRHADPEVFSEYRAQLVEQGAQIDELSGNYRSRHEVLDAVARILDGAPGIEPRPLQALNTFEPTAAPIVRLFVGDGDDPAAAEAAQAAQHIGALVDAGEFKYGDIAVLFRSFGGMPAFERAFEEAQIPFLVSGGRGFLEARECLDVLNFIAALANPLDEIALVGVLRSPILGLTGEAIHALTRDGWRQLFEERFGELRRLAGFFPPDLLIARALDETGYFGSLNARAQANVRKLLAHVRRMTQRERRRRPHGLAELLEDLEALRRSASIADAPPPDAGDVVRLMTIHAAKGLEFPVVFVSALHKGADSQSPALLFSHDGLGVKWRHPAQNKTISDPLHASLKEIARAREDAEENRLLYVALTRAEQRLILSYAATARQSGWQKLVSAVLAPSPAPSAQPLATGDRRLAPAPPELAPGSRPLAPVLHEHDSTASVTSVALHAACPRRYYLSRYLGLEPEPESQSTGALALGSAVHRALAGVPAESPEAAELAARFTNSNLGRRASQARRREHEFDVLFEVEDMLLRGNIDLWFEEKGFEDGNGEIILVDYKTDRDESASLAYALQLRLYAMALEVYAGRLPDRAVLYYLRPDRAFDVPLTGEHMEKAREAVAALKNAQQTRVYPTAPGAQCQKCQFWKGICPEGREERLVAAEAKSDPALPLPSSSPEPARDGS